MNRKTNRLYTFNNFQLEVNERLLKCEEEIIPITPKAFDILVLLLEHKGKIVEKEFLLNEVWANTYITEATLAQNILTLRKILGKQPDGKHFIETVPRFGYRFVGEVKEIIGSEEILAVERHIKTEITSEHRIYSDDEAITVKKDSHQQPLFYRLRKNRALTLSLGLISAAVLVLTVFSVGNLWTAKSFAETKFNETEVTKLTAEGNVSRAALSPDGKYLAFTAIHPNGDSSMFVRQIENSATVQILPPQSAAIIGLTFSPDGNQIYYVTYEKDSSTTHIVGNLYSIPMLGGTPKAILRDLDSTAAISPDGKQIAFIRFSAEDKKAHLVTASIDGKNEKPVISRNLMESFSSNGLSWSPDGKTIACSAFVNGEIGKQMEMLLIDASTGEQKTLSKENWLWIGQPDWLKDGSGIIFPAWNSRSGNATDEIWMVTTEGKAKQISSGINGIFSLNLTSDSNALMAVKSERLTDFWTASAPDFEKSAVKILQNRNEFIRSFPGIGWLADNRIVFGSSFNGDLDVWTMNADGSQRKQITREKAADFFPAASGDGQTIVFISNRMGRENLFRMQADGSKPEQLTDEINVSYPNIAPDNRTVYYLSLDEKNSKYFLRKIDLETKESTQITSYPVSSPRLSPDGKFIVCYYPEIKNGDVQENKLMMTILSTETNQVVRQFETKFYQTRFSPIQWKGSQSLTYLTDDKGDTRIWEQPITGGEASLLLNLPQTSVFRFAWSGDGKNLVYESGQQINDVILLKNSERN